MTGNRLVVAQEMGVGWGWGWGGRRESRRHQETIRGNGYVHYLDSGDGVLGEYL